jgi:pyrroloquinoline quinone biosynthesis protein E
VTNTTSANDVNQARERTYLPVVSVTGPAKAAGGSCSTPSYGMVDPYLIERKGPTRDVQIKPLFTIPTLAHIEITYACMEDCIMCYNPTRTKVSDRDKEVVWDIVRSVASQRIPHTYLIGGEPTYGYTAAELSDMVDYLSDHGSSVTIVTNGQIHLKKFNPRLACFGVSLHGADADMHDSITRKPGSFKRAVAAARMYVEDGHDVRIVPVVMGRNHDQMYKIAELADDIGAESIYYDIYEPGGIGEENSHDASMHMQPSINELRAAIGQIVDAHDDFPFRGSVGIGTAMPYCFDERLAERHMFQNCGVGTYFCAITNTGDMRMCNQSKMRLGNVRERSLREIWTDPLFDEVFRNLKWVEEPCASCPVLADCGGGCKVDEGCASGELCIDRVVRGLSPDVKLKLSAADGFSQRLSTDLPDQPRRFRANRYLALTDMYQEWGDIFFKTRYQTIRITANERSLIQAVLDHQGVIDERDFIATFEEWVDEKELRLFVTSLSQAGAIDLVS